MCFKCDFYRGYNTAQVLETLYPDLGLHIISTYSKYIMTFVHQNHQPKGTLTSEPWHGHFYFLSYINQTHMCNVYTKWTFGFITKYSYIALKYSYTHTYELVMRTKVHDVHFVKGEPECPLSWNKKIKIKKLYGPRFQMWNGFKKIILAPWPGPILKT